MATPCGDRLPTARPQRPHRRRQWRHRRRPPPVLLCGQRGLWSGAAHTSVRTALALDKSVFHDRPLRVFKSVDKPKKTNEAKRVEAKFQASQATRRLSGKGQKRKAPGAARTCCQPSSTEASQGEVQFSTASLS